MRRTVRVPSGGTLRTFDPPGGVGIRLDTFARAGYTPPMSFDSLLAKLVIHVPSGRIDDLLRRAYRASVRNSASRGYRPTSGLLQNLVRNEDVAAGRIHTRFIDEQGARLASGMAGHPRLHADGPETAPVTEPAPAHPNGPAGSTAVCASLGGRLVRFSVRPGDRVQTNQPVAVIESMKMEHTVVAHETGRVLDLAAAPGDAVTPGAVLLFIEPFEHAGEMAQDLEPGHDLQVEQRLQELVDRKAALLDAQRPGAVAKQRARGACTARERIAQLCDADSFVEMGGLIHSETAEDAPADGLVIGSARIDGRSVMVMAQDFSVFGGSNGHLGRTKMFRAMARSRLNGLPFIMLLDGGGHRIQDGQNSRHYASSTPAYQEFARLSGWVPIVAAVLGSGFAANTNNCGMADLVIMVRGKAEMGPRGAGVGEGRHREQITAQALGGAEVAGGPPWARRSRRCRRGRGVLGHSALSRLPFRRTPAWRRRAPRPSRAPRAKGYATSYPPTRARATTCASGRDLGRYRHLASKSSRPSVRACSRPLGRLAGRPVGFIANQPLVMGGMLDANACEKAAHFIALC